MSNEILPNPEESHRLCQNIDRLLIEHLKVTNLPVSTAQLYDYSLYSAAPKLTWMKKDFRFKIVQIKKNQKENNTNERKNKKRNKINVPILNIQSLPEFVSL